MNGSNAFCTHGHMIISCDVSACNQSGVTDRGTFIPGLSLIADPQGKMLFESAVEYGGYCMTEFDQTLEERLKNSRMGWFDKQRRIYFLKRF